MLGIAMRRGCLHCVTCSRLPACREAPCEMAFWPAGLQSPTVYYLLRERQLEFNIRAAEAEGPAAWRQRSVAGDAPNTLLQRRGLPQMNVKLPLTAGYGVKYGETAVFVRTIDCPAASTPPALCKPAPAAQAAAAEATYTLTPPPTALPGAHLRLATPEQPAKRSRRALMSTQPAAAGSHPGAAVRAATPPPGHFIASAAQADGCTQQQEPVLIPMPQSRTSSSGISSMSVTPASSAASHASAASSPLLAFFHKVKEMLSPGPVLPVTAC